MRNKNVLYYDILYFYKHFSMFWEHLRHEINFLIISRFPFLFLSIFNAPSYHTTIVEYRKKLFPVNSFDMRWQFFPVYLDRHTHSHTPSLESVFKRHGIRLPQKQCFWFVVLAPPSRILFYRQFRRIFAGVTPPAPEPDKANPMPYISQRGKICSGLGARGEQRRHCALHVAFSFQLCLGHPFRFSLLFVCQSECVCVLFVCFALRMSASSLAEVVSCHAHCRAAQRHATPCRSSHTWGPKVSVLSFHSQAIYSSIRASRTARGWQKGGWVREGEGLLPF